MIKEKFEMPIVYKDLPFNAYQMRGFEWGCLLSCGKEVLPFLYTFCTNVFVNSRRFKLDFTFDKYSWFDCYGVFKCKYIFVDDTPKEEWLSLLKETMTEGHYAYGMFDEFYIPNKYSYNRRHFDHAFLIYGFDDSKGVFLAVGYTANERYESYTIPYDNFYDAVSYYKNTYGWISLLHVKPDYIFEFSPRHVWKEFRDYLASDYTERNRIEGEIYGVEAMEWVADYVAETVASKEYLNLKTGRFIAEYRAYTHTKLKFMYDNGYLLNDHSERYLELVSPAQTVHLLFLKYNMTGNYQLGDRIVSILRESLKREIEIFSNVKAEMESKGLNQL